MEDKIIGKAIRRFRERNAWTQEHLAGAAEVSVRTVQRAEEGFMSTETLRALAGALGVELDQLSRPISTSHAYVMPVLYYDKLETLDWLVRVFGFEIRVKYTGRDGQLLHAELAAERAAFMVGAPSESEKFASPKMLGGTNTQSLCIHVKDADAHHRRAVEAGAEIVSEPTIAHGVRRYAVKDPEGHLWYFFHPVLTR